MKKFTLATAAATTLSATVLGFAAPALAAPSGPGNAADTISQLEADGNRVIVNRQNSTPLADADVVSVRPGSPIREWTWDRQGDDRVLQEVGKVLFVDVR